MPLTCGNRVAHGGPRLRHNGNHLWPARPTVAHAPTGHPLTCENAGWPTKKHPEMAHHKINRPLTCGNAGGPSGPPTGVVATRTDHPGDGPAAGPGTARNDNPNPMTSTTRRSTP